MQVIPENHETHTEKKDAAYIHVYTHTHMGQTLKNPMPEIFHKLRVAYIEI